MWVQLHHHPPRLALPTSSLHLSVPFQILATVSIATKLNKWAWKKHASQMWQAAARWSWLRLSAFWRKGASSLCQRQAYTHTYRQTETHTERHIEKQHPFSTAESSALFSIKVSMFLQLRNISKSRRAYNSWISVSAKGKRANLATEANQEAKYNSVNLACH